MTDQTALWTIMVYISGDSVLDNFAIESLKQLRDAASDRVTVEVLFNPNGRRESWRLRFDENHDSSASLFAGVKNKKTSLRKNAPGKISVHLDPVAPKTLRGFIDSVTDAPDLPTAYGANRHYGLVLWGHGPELLVDTEEPSNKKSGTTPDGKYLTPAKLRDALADTKLLMRKPLKDDEKGGAKAARSFRKLDFIALDACSMSMVEVAAELRDYAKFMIASQDDVPDQSYPYEAILSQLRQTSDAREASREIPEEYEEAFQDYFPAPGPALTNITLSSLNLQNIEDFTVLLGRLAAALQRLAFASRDARKAIIRARSASRSFVLGLFVDIYDFCQNLEKQKNLGRDLKPICRRIRKALTVNNPKSDLVLNNKTNERGKVRCHGLSIYLPYLTAKESERIEASLTIGGTAVVTQLSKNASTTNLHKGGSPTNLHKSRAERIAETEEDLGSLDLFNKKTRWEDFIKCTWSFILAKEEPLELDLHYSAQQCVLNLLSTIAASGKIQSQRKIRGQHKIRGRSKIRGLRKIRSSGKSEDPNIPGKRAA